MEFQRKNPTELWKVVIRGEDRQIAPGRDGTHQEVGIRSLNALGPAAVEKVSGLLEIRGLEFEVGEGSQVVAQDLELLVSLEAGQEFLADRSDDNDPTLPYQLRQFLNDEGWAWFGAAKRQRPDGRVDKNPHKRRRCFL